jgi:hypothetical protein
MNIENWNTRAEQIMATVNDKNFDIGASKAAVLGIIAAGNASTTDEERDAFWASLRGMNGAQDEAHKFIHKGQRRNPIHAQSFSVIETALTEAFTLLYENVMIQTICMPSKRTGGTYTLETFLEARVSSEMGKLERAIKEKRWDGTLQKNGLPKLVAFPNGGTE